MLPADITASMLWLENISLYALKNPNASLVKTQLIYEKIPINIRYGVINTRNTAIIFLVSILYKKNMMMKNIGMR